MNFVPLFVCMMLVWNLQTIEGGKILIVGTIFSGSHLLTMRELAKSLVGDGHEVTILRWRERGFQKAMPYPNITEKELTINNTHGSHSVMSQEEKAGFQFPRRHMWQHGLGISLFPLDASLTLRQICMEMLANKGLQRELLQEGYSLAIVDLLFNDCGLGLAYKLGIPTIGFWAFHFGSGPSMHTPAFNPPSTTPQVMSHLVPPMNIWQRILSSFLSVSYLLLLQIQFVFSYSAMRLYIPDCPYPPTLLANMSGVLINSNPSFNPPILLPPTFVEIAGMHLRTPGKLPQDIEDFIEGSGHSGVILFSLGIIFDAESMSADYFEGYFRVFQKLEHKVIVKANKLPKNVPKNVLVRSFVPQQDILAHNKTKLFITHCGMHSIVESVHHGVPMVGIPIFLDQKDNLLRLQLYGVAQGLEKDSSESDIFEAINEVLTNSSYKENVQELKKRMSYHGDPLQKALGLINHVISTKGAEHLKMESRHFNIFQFLCLDIVVLICLGICLFYVILRQICSRIFKTVKLKED